MTTINNYPILNQSYLQNSQIPCTPAFLGGGVGSNGLSAQALRPMQNIPVTSPQISSTLSYSPDTVEISAENKIKTQKTKKQGMSTAAKVGLTVAGGLATVYGCVVGHRMLSKPTIEKVAKNFSEIFRRDVSVEDAKKMTEEYKNIFAEHDKDKFVDAIFEQLKKDYGYASKPLPLKFENLGGANKDGKQVYAHWNPFDCNIALNTEVFKALPQKLSKENQNEICEYITHELQHVKQSEFAYRTNPQRYLNNIVKDDEKFEYLLFCITKCPDHFIKEFAKKGVFKNDESAKNFTENAILKLKNNKFENDEIIKKIANMIKFSRQQKASVLFKDFEQFNNNDKSYQMGLNYLIAKKDYTNADYNKYISSLLEKEAYGTKDKINIMFKYIANPWRIF